MTMTDWLHIERGDAPLIVSIPHAGTIIPEEIAGSLLSLALATHDADLYVDRLYEFANGLGATVIHTALSRTVIDVNRDPSGASLYPGQATTGLCPLTTFDGVPLYRPGVELDEAEVERRLRLYFNPYHAALTAEIERLRAAHPAVVLYEAHSIRSHVPRLFDGQLPQFNIGTNDGRSCAHDLASAVEAACSTYPGEGRGPGVGAPDSGPRPSPGRTVVDGRFKGGWTTRHYGVPDQGVHAVQMELAMRGYLDEQAPWPPHWDEARAAPLQETLGRVLAAGLDFARTRI